MGGKGCVLPSFAPNEGFWVNRLSGCSSYRCLRYFFRASAIQGRHQGIENILQHIAVLHHWIFLFLYDVVGQRKEVMQNTDLLDSFTHNHRATAGKLYHEKLDLENCSKTLSPLQRKLRSCAKTQIRAHSTYLLMIIMPLKDNFQWHSLIVRNMIWTLLNKIVHFEKVKIIKK